MIKKALVLIFGIGLLIIGFYLHKKDDKPKDNSLSAIQLPAPSGSSVDWNSYYPLQVGNTWTYGPKEKKEDVPLLTIKVSGTETVDGIECYLLDTVLGEDHIREFLEVRENEGIFHRKTQTSTGGVDSNIIPTRINPLIKFPIEIGSSWQWVDDAPQEVNPGVINFRVDGYEKVDTPAGIFECFKVVSSHDVPDIMESTMTRWYAANTGMVKQQHRIVNKAQNTPPEEMVIVLYSYELNK